MTTSTLPLYQYKGRTLTAVLYVGFFALCVLGFAEWRRAVTKADNRAHPAEHAPAPA